MTSKVRIGCAGWSLSSANAENFPSDGSHLERYAAVFSAVEINSSFYRSHRPATYARWRESVPQDFRFSVKFPRTITHECRLHDAQDLLSQFLNEVGQLEEKLGCLLLQLPPSLKFAGKDAEEFFRMLRQSTNVAVACEPRHPTWFSDEAADAMRRHLIGCVDADPRPVEHAVPDGFEGTRYIRLHGSPVMYRSAYSAAFLQSMASKVMQSDVLPVWCIFDNTAEGAAIPDALSLMRLLA